MVFQIAGIVLLPVVMMMVLSPPPGGVFSEEPEVEVLPEESENGFLMFFVLWVIWILIMIRVAYKVKKGTFRMRKIL